MPWAIETYALTKRFPKPHSLRQMLPAGPGPAKAAPAVDRVSLAVKEGELFGLLGPNGAGKTTLIKLLSTLVVPTSGSAQVCGFDLGAGTAIKSCIGLATSDERSFYWRLTGRQNLEFFAALHGLPEEGARERVEGVLGQTGLSQAAGERFQSYSTGMRQRLTIARALLNVPRLLFLDEPTKSLDPAAAQQLHDLILRLREQERVTVFLTTHNLPEAEKLCDRIAIIDHGRICACGTLAELRADFGLQDRMILQVRGFRPEMQSRLERELPGVQVELLEPEGAGHSRFTGEQDPGDPGRVARVEIEAHPGDSALDVAIGILRENQGVIQSVSHEPASLENIFRRVTQEGDPAGVAGSETVHLVRERPPDVQSDIHSGSRLSPGAWMRIAMAFLRRDFGIETSYRFSFFLQFFGIFFTAAVFYFIARLLGGAASPYLATYGGDYFSFVLIGIAFASYFSVGLSSFSDSLRQAQTTGTLEAMLTTPTDLSTIILSSSLWEYLLTSFKVLIYLAIGAGLLGVNLGKGNYPAAALVLALTITSFSSLGIIAASFIMVLKRGDPVTWAFSALSSLLGGVYYPIAVMPGWMQALSNLLPITYALRAMRLALLQGASLQALLPDVLALVLFSIVLLPLSLIAFRYAVYRARVEGSLTHY